MALFNDGQINSLQDLERYESALLDVTSLERIDVTAKMALAQDLIASELLLFLLKRSSSYPGSYIWTCPASVRRRLGVSDVVVTEPLKRRHALKTIELTYQDAYYNQLNDRYQAKWRQYQQRAEDASITLEKIGVGLVFDPIVRAEAPLLVAVAGSIPATNYYVRMTWLNHANQEGAPSDVVALLTADGTQLLVSPIRAPLNAAGWNVYAGSTPEGCSRQNGAPIGVQADWSVPLFGLKDGSDIGQGQAPDRYVVDHRGIQRG